MVYMFYSEEDCLYCNRCGEATSRTPVFVDYSATTGQKRYKVRRRCPNSRWWNFHMDETMWPDEPPPPPPPDRG